MRPPGILHVFSSQAAQCSAFVITTWQLGNRSFRQACEGRVNNTSWSMSAWVKLSLTVLDLLFVLCIDDAAVSKQDFCYWLIKNESWSMNHVIGAYVYTHLCKPSFSWDFACNLHSLCIVLYINWRFPLLLLLPLSGAQGLKNDSMWEDDLEFGVAGVLRENYACVYSLLYFTGRM